MKKLIYVASATFMLCMASACNNIGSNRASSEGVADSVSVEEEDDTVLAFSTVEKDESVDVDKGHATVHLKCAYAVKGKKVLKDSINAFLEQLLIYDEGEKALCVEGGDIRKKLLNFVDSLIASNEKDLKGEIEAMIEFAEPGEDLDMVNYEDELDVNVAYENSDYVTLFVSNYMYRNGAHGMSTTYGVTFSKEDGHICGNELLKNYSKAELQSLMLKGLQEHFGEGDDGASVAELAEFTFIETKDLKGNIPMPSMAAFLLKDGVHLIYQQYEIAPYAAGKPEIVVPLK